ncbi:MAG: glycosyltransferase family 2 protein [Candidatus Shapirobacteria bacterium]
MAQKITQLSVVIIAGNEASMILDCLGSAAFASEVILVAANSTDDTVKIAKSIRPDLIVTKTSDSYNKNFSKWRNLGSNLATKPWLFHLDADERFTPQLTKEISKLLTTPQTSTHFAVPRANFFLGTRVKHGGSYPDYVIRLFQKSVFHGHTGFLHEQPIVDGILGYLNNPLLHFTHRHLSSMVTKTISWTDMEAIKIFKTGHPPVVWWRFVRMMFTKLWERLIVGQFWRDGTIGFISSIFEAFDTFIIYARLYELQHSSNHENRTL